MAIKLITLDLDNTLWETDPVIISAEKACHDWIVTNVPQAAEFYTLEALRDYKNDIAECYPQLRHKVSELRLEVLRRVFLQAGISGDEGRRKAQQAFDVFYQARSNVRLYDGALTALEALSQDYALIAVTNGNANLKLIGIDHLFTAHFNAEGVGAAKPNPDLFNAALQQAGASAAQCIHIGDHQEQDIVAAHRLGIKTIWVNLCDAAWAEDECTPDCEVNHLSQLVGAVEQIVENNL